MMKFLENSLDEMVLDKDTHIIEMFSWVSWTKNIIVESYSNITYLLVAKDADIDIHFMVKWSHATCKIFVLAVSQGKPLKINFLTTIYQSSVQVDKHIVALYGNDWSIAIDANIAMETWVENVSGHLLEENIVLWKNVSVKTLPALQIHAHNVRASHGARIERINKDMSFYMAAKGLDQSTTQSLIVDGYVNSILTFFQDFAQEKLTQIKTFVQL